MRYAIYFTPPSSDALLKVAANWLGRNAFSGEPVKLPAITPKLSETPGETKWLGPALGEHNTEVLRSLGYDEEQIAQLKREQVI